MEDFYEHIDDYKNGLLTGEVLAQFEAAVDCDPSLKLAVDNYHAAKRISEGLLEIDMLQTLQDIEKTKNQTLSSQISNNQTTPKTNHLLQNIDRSINSSSKSKVSIFNLRNLVVAASIIGVLFFTGWWMMKSPYSHLDKEQVFASFVDPVNEDATKSVDTIGMTAFEKGMHYYALNRFEESEQWLKLSLKEEMNKNMRSKGYYWLGAAHLRQWELDEAVEAWGKSNEKEALKLIDQLVKK